MNHFDAATYHIWHKFAEMQVSRSPTTPVSQTSALTSLPLQLPAYAHAIDTGNEQASDPLTVKETDLERRCLSTLTDALRTVICYAHSSYKIPISFQVKRFDRAHGQVWVKVSPDEVPEGFDLKYLLQHIKFYENISRYAELLNVDDYRLRNTCQFFLDLQSRAASPKSDDPLEDIARVRETISRTTKWLQEMISVGMTDRDVVQQLQDGQLKLRELNIAVDKFSAFQQNQSKLIKASNTWYPEKQQRAARSIHQQMQHLLEDPEVVKYVLQVVGPRLGLVPFQFTPPPPGPLLT